MGFDFFPEKLDGDDESRISQGREFQSSVHVYPVMQRALVT